MPVRAKREASWRARFRSESIRSSWGHIMIRVDGLKGFRTLLIVFLVFTATPKARAEFQNDQVGFSPHHVFESSNEGENVDALTGNLTLTIPLGPTIKLNDILSYGVTLTYNAKQWE